MSTISLPVLQRLTKELEAARLELARAQRLVAVLELQSASTTLTMTLTVGSVSGGCDNEQHIYRLIECERHQTPKVAPNRETVHAQIRRFAQERVIACAGWVEGVEFQIRKLAKAAGSTP